MARRHGAGARHRGPSAGGSIDACLRGLRRRATIVHGLRAALTALGGAALAFLLVCLFAPSVVTGPIAVLAWSLVGGAFLAGLVAFGRHLSRLRRGGAARLLEPLDPSLASALRSAYDLAVRTEAHGTSDALRDAHASSTAARAHAVDPRVVTPWSQAVDRGAFASIGVVALVALTVSASDSLAIGAFALLHPARTTAEGQLISDVVRSTQITLRHPAYLGMGDASLRDPESIEAPVGTFVRVRVDPRVRAERATLHTPDGEVPLAPDGEGRLVGAFLVHRGGPLRIELSEDGKTSVIDARRRSVTALRDEAPAVTLHADPPPSAAVALDSVALRYEAADDHGLRSVALVVESPGGQRHRQSLVDPSGLEARLARGDHRLALAPLDVRPGDELRLWVEATDHDDVSGPNVGKSEVVVVALPSESSGRAEDLESLQAVLNGSLDALADRLEQPVAAEDAQTPSEERRARVQTTTSAAASLAKAWVTTAAERDLLDKADRALVARFAKDIDRALTRERGSHRGGATITQAKRADAKLVTLLEEGSLALADVLARSRIADAAALARELESLRREMTSLLAELRRADSPEARRALMTALRRAEARLEDLSARIAAMGQDVPSDFVNTQDLPRQEGADALASLEAALDRDDLDAAERSLLDFERQIDAMAEALGQAEQDFTEARFGDRQRQMAEALEALRGLEVEQSQLARDTQAVRARAAERAARAIDHPQEVAREVTEKVQRLATDARALGRQRLTEADRDSLDRLAARLGDVRAALDQGDLGESQRMAREAADAAQTLARDLALSALMFPGSDGHLRRSADAARRIADRSEGVSSEIDRAIPRYEDHVSPGERRAMAESRTRQRLAHERASELAERFEGADGQMPLSPETGQGLREIERGMGAATEALGVGDPIAAANHQRDAARGLKELREELEQNRRSEQGGGSGGMNGGIEGAMRPDQEVVIPGRSAGTGNERRRLVLDGMRETAPVGYEDAVRRYYEELLR